MLDHLPDADTLQQIIGGSLVVLGVLAVLVVRVVRRLLLKLALIALIVSLAASLWLQRAALQDCVETCSCQLFGHDVAVPADTNPNCT